MKPTLFFSVHHMAEFAGKEFRVYAKDGERGAVVRVAVAPDAVQRGDVDELLLLNNIANEATLYLTSGVPDVLPVGVTIPPDGMPLGAFEMKPPRWDIVHLPAKAVRVTSAPRPRWLERLIGFSWGFVASGALTVLVYLATGGR